MATDLWKEGQMTEPRINVSTGFSGGLSVSLRADSTSELEALLEQVRQAGETNTTIQSLFAPVLGIAEKQAVANVTATFPAAQQSTVGQASPAPQRQPSAAPPNVVPVGPCQHGERVYQDRMSKGRPWRFWDCPLPYDKDNNQKCKPINAEFN